MPKRTQSFDPRQNMLESHMEAFHNYDERGRVVDLHHHDFYEIYYFLNGDVEYRVEGKRYRMQKGDLLLISPGVFHQPVVDPGLPYERYVLWIDRSYLARYTSHGTDLAACFDPAGAVLLRPSSYERSTLAMLLEELCGEEKSEKYGSELYRHALFIQILTRINRMSPGTAPKRTAPQPTPELVSQVLAYIAAHYREKISLQQLADHFYVSKYHLSHAFSAQVGTSIYRYILLKRLLSAREMISDGISPSEACQSCGFQDYANFYRVFKAEYGVSPKAFAAKAVR